MKNFEAMTKTELEQLGKNTVIFFTRHIVIKSWMNWICEKKLINYLTRTIRNKTTTDTDTANAYYNLFEVKILTHKVLY